MRKHIFQSHQDLWKRLVLAWSDGVMHLHEAAISCRGMCWIHYEVHLRFQSTRLFNFLFGLGASLLVKKFLIVGYSSSYAQNVHGSKHLAASP